MCRSSAMKFYSMATAYGASGEVRGAFWKRNPSRRVPGLLAEPLPAQLVGIDFVSPGRILILQERGPSDEKHAQAIKFSRNARFPCGLETNPCD